MVVSKPNGDVTQPLTVAEAQDVVRAQAKNRGEKMDGWRLKVRGEEFGVVRHDLELIMQRWANLVRNNDEAGDAIILDIIDHPYSIVSRWVRSEEFEQTKGNRDIDQIFTWWHKEYPKSRNAGICVYKFSGSTPSQHCNWTDNNAVPGDGANASDEFLATMEMMKDGAAEAVRLGKRFLATNGDDGIPVGRMIIADRIWDPFKGWHAYTGDYHYHNHMEGRWWLIDGNATRC